LQQIAKEENADLRENAAGLSCGVEGIC